MSRRTTAAKESSLNSFSGSPSQRRSILTASILYFKASEEFDPRRGGVPAYRWDRCAAECAMIQLKDEAFERSSGNQTSLIGLNSVTSRSSNIIAAWVPIPTTLSARYLQKLIYQILSHNTYSDAKVSDAGSSGEQDTSGTGQASSSIAHNSHHITAERECWDISLHCWPR